HDEPAPEKGCSVPLFSPDGTETIGVVLRTRDNVKPLYVSIGHAVTLEEAIELTLACTTRYRLPETTRAAHRLSIQIINN
ncbi:MAG: endonuclease V, partial [Rhodothermales bacterium]